MSLAAVLVVPALWLEQGLIKAAHQVLACPVPAETPWVHCHGLGSSCQEIHLKAISCSSATAGQPSCITLKIAADRSLAETFLSLGS